MSGNVVIHINVGDDGKDNHDLAAPHLGHLIGKECWYAYDATQSDD